jgi:large subunit ribosomal protein L33
LSIATHGTFLARYPFGRQDFGDTIGGLQSPHFNGELFGTNLMAKSKKKAETVFLVCDETGDHNYTLRRKPGGEKLKLSKFSPRLRKHTMHTEKKK